MYRRNNRSLAVLWMYRIRTCLLLAFLGMWAGAMGQDESGEEPVDQWTEEQASAFADRQEELGWLRRRPVSLNESSEQELMQLPLMDRDRARYLIQYRQLLGPLTCLYELQAVPGWDLSLIRRILPFVRVEGRGGDSLNWKQRLYRGDHDVQGRVAGGFQWNGDSLEPAGKDWVGDRISALIRYRYNYGTRWAYGLTLQKDAGESWWARSYGPDFSSFYLHWRGGGRWRELLAGDFTLQWGQGLVIWQGWAALGNWMWWRGGPSAKPHRGLDEQRFIRGLYLRALWGRTEAELMAGLQKQDVTLATDSTRLVSRTWGLAGLHRTPAERERRRNTQRVMLGGRIGRRIAGWDWHAHLLFSTWERPWDPGPEPHRQSDLRGRSWLLAGVDYRGRAANLFQFGEWAMDQRGRLAGLHGFFWSPARTWNVQLVVRLTGSGYFSADAQTVSVLSRTGQEWVFQGQWSFAPSRRWQWQTRSQLTWFPYSRYLLAGASQRADWESRVQWLPSRRESWMLRWLEQREEFAVSGWSYRHKRELRLEGNRELGVKMAGARWNWGLQHRLAFNFWQSDLLDGRTAGAESGWTAQASVTGICQPRGFRVLLGGGVFDVGSWSGRIYTYLPGWGGDGRFEGLTGQGGWMVVSLDKRWGQEYRVRLRWTGQVKGINADNQLSSYLFRSAWMVQWSWQKSS